MATYIERMSCNLFNQFPTSGCLYFQSFDVIKTITASRHKAKAQSKFNQGLNYAFIYKLSDFAPAIWVLCASLSSPAK